MRSVGGSIIDNHSKVVKYSTARWLKLGGGRVRIQSSADLEDFRINSPTLINLEVTFGFANEVTGFPAISSNKDIFFLVGPIPLV